MTKRKAGVQFIFGIDKLPCQTAQPADSGAAYFLEQRAGAENIVRSSFKPLLKRTKLILKQCRPAAKPAPPPPYRAFLSWTRPAFIIKDGLHHLCFISLERLHEIRKLSMYLCALLAF
jgi:hypothetical protein